MAYKVPAPQPRHRLGYSKYQLHSWEFQLFATICIVIYADIGYN